MIRALLELGSDWTQKGGIRLRLDSGGIGRARKGSEGLGRARKGARLRRWESSLSETERVAWMLACRESGAARVRATSEKPSEAIRSHQKPSEAIRSHQKPPDATRCHQMSSRITAASRERARLPRVLPRVRRLHRRCHRVDRANLRGRRRRDVARVGEEGRIGRGEAGGDSGARWTVGQVR